MRIVSLIEGGSLHAATPGSFQPALNQSDNHLSLQSQNRGLSPRALLKKLQQNKNTHEKVLCL